MDYLMENGYNIAQVDLDAIVPQPRTDSTVQAVQRSYGVSGVVHEQGLWIPLQWSSLGTVASYQALLAQLGLTSALQAEGTWYLPDHEYTWRRYNGIAIRPAQGDDIRRSNYFISDVTIRVIKLVAL
jgi:hypothetical protein